MRSSPLSVLLAAQVLSEVVLLRCAHLVLRFCCFLLRCLDLFKFFCANYLDLFGFLCANCLDLFRLFDNERYLMKFRTTNSLSPLMYFARGFILHKLTATPIGWKPLSVTRSKKQKSKAIMHDRNGKREKSGLSASH